MSRPALALDIDDVMAGFMPAIRAHFAQQGIALPPPNQQAMYHFHEYVGWTSQETNEFVYEFLAERGHQIAPVPGSVEGIPRLAEEWELYAVTSRAARLEEPTRQWLELSYGPVFRDVLLGSYYEGERTEKSELCRRIGAERLIDDNLLYATEAAADGIAVTLFDDGYGWNQAPTLPPGVTRARGWAELVRTTITHLDRAA
jgi:uncharacterized HAD superfamily protein